VSANDRQVAGNHYREIAEKAGAPQHWDLMWSLYGEAWFVGCVTKYVLRYRKKNGVEDLKKAQHYLEKLIELETAAEKRKVVVTCRPDGPKFTEAKMEAWEACCECGKLYPQVDLHEDGYIYCPECRKKPEMTGRS